VRACPYAPAMRPDDGDDDLAGGGDDDALEDGLDETVLHGTFSTSSDPYGDGLGDDTYDSGDADGTPGHGRHHRHQPARRRRRR
jgi:hypothetical protein